MLTIFYWAWFRVNKCQPYIRMHLVLTLLSTIIAIIAGKTLALLLPFRFRPIHEEGLNLILPYGMKLTTLEGWSSFPSDHAVMFYALSTGIFLPITFYSHISNCRSV